MSEIFVDPDLGNDANAGTEAAPYATLYKASQEHSAGDSVFVKAGTTSTEANSLTPADNSTWGRYGPGADPKFVKTTSGDAVVLNDVAVQFAYLDVEAQDGNGFMVQGDCTGTVVSLLTVHDCSETGCYADSTSSGLVTFQDVISSNNTDDGFGCFGSVQFFCNRCTANGHTSHAASDGFTAHGSASISMLECIAFDNIDGVHHINTSGNNIVDRCLIYDNAVYGVHMAAFSGGTYTSKCTVKNSIVVAPITPTIDRTACIFVGPGNFVDGGLNTLVVPNTTAFWSAALKVETERDLDMRGDKILVNYNNFGALYFMNDDNVANAGTSTYWGDHDLSEVNPLTPFRFRFFGGLFNYAQWTAGGGSPGSNVIPNSFDLDTELPDHRAFQIEEDSPSAHRDATRSFTSVDYLGQPREANNYSRGALEPYVFTKTFETLHSQIRTKWNQRVEDAVRLPTEMPNEGFDNTQEVSWAKLDIDVVETLQHSIGKKNNKSKDRIFGSLDIELHQALRIGNRESNRLIDHIAGVFDDLKIDDNLVFRQTEVLDRLTQDNEFVTRLSIPFESTQLVTSASRTTGSSDTVEELINNLTHHYFTEITTGESLTTAFENVKIEEPNDDSLWTSLSIRLGSKFTSEISTVNVDRQSGVLFGSVYLPIRSGERDGLQKADIIRNTFRIVSIKGVTFRSPTVVNVGRFQRWWRMDVTVPFLLSS